MKIKKTYATMQLIKKIKSIALFSLCSTLLFAQPNNWKVDENNFEYTMTVVAFLSVDNNRLSNSNDLVGAFVGNEIRGVTKLTHVASEDAYYAYLTVFANKNNEEITFKIYDSTKDSVINTGASLRFETLAHHGNLLQAFSIASPSLSNKTEITSIGFNGVEVLKHVEDGNVITLDVVSSANLGIAILNFELSPGAELLYNNKVLTSNASSLNLQDAPFTMQVRSGDHAVLRTVTVNINSPEGNSNMPMPKYYRKHKTCNALGAIKVKYTSDGTIVTLKKENEIMLAETLDENAEVVFENLDAGIYEVVIGSHTKKILINDIN